MADQPLDENTPSQHVAIYAPPREMRGRRDWRRIGAAASLSLVTLIGAAAMAAHIHALGATHPEMALEQKLDAISNRLEALEASRAHDEIVGVRKSLAEVKFDVRDAGARIDELAGRVNPATSKIGELAARLDKLEGKTTNAAVVPAKPSPSLKPTAGVSNEATGSIGKASVRLRGFWIQEIHNGYVRIDSPEGEFEAAPGDVLPGAGRVLRIEHLGRDWVVVTTEGRIESQRY